MAPAQLARQVPPVPPAPSTPHGLFATRVHGIVTVEELGAGLDWQPTWQQGGGAKQASSNSHDESSLESSLEASPLPSARFSLVPSLSASSPQGLTDWRQLRTPLGSVWKLFVYVYLVDNHMAPPDFQCTGQDVEEHYCCDKGASIDMDRALVKSCAQYFDPLRLKLDRLAWHQYWSRVGAPAWLQELGNLLPGTEVRVSSLLEALDSVPGPVRRKAAAELISVMTMGTARGAVAAYGSMLRVKTWTMRAGRAGWVGGAAGWLADGTAVWISGKGNSRNVLFSLAPYLVPRLLGGQVPDTSGCVQVNFFARYPINKILAGNVPLSVNGQGQALKGQLTVVFENGQRLGVASRGELTASRDERGRLVIRATLGLNDYVARVVEREGQAKWMEASKALAVLARTYAVQQAPRQGGCFQIADSSRWQRVLPRPAGAGARGAANFTDSLILTGSQVFYRLDGDEPGTLSWVKAEQSAAEGKTFDAILAEVWPHATLVAMSSSQSGDCLLVAGADKWLEAHAPDWARRLDSVDGFELPAQPAVCKLTASRPYSDAGQNRIYISRLTTSEERLTLVHEWLHLAFAHHPRGLDEDFIEGWARRLLGINDF